MIYINAKNKSIGRLKNNIINFINKYNKNKIKVVNFNQLRINKKKYIKRYTGYPGGIKKYKLKEIFNKPIYYINYIRKITNIYNNILIIL